MLVPQEYEALESAFNQAVAQQEARFGVPGTDPSRTMDVLEWIACLRALYGSKEKPEDMANFDNAPGIYLLKAGAEGGAPAEEPGAEEWWRRAREHWLGRMRGQLETTEGPVSATARFAMAQFVAALSNPTFRARVNQQKASLDSLRAASRGDEWLLRAQTATYVDAFVDRVMRARRTAAKGSGKRTAPADLEGAAVKRARTMVPPAQPVARPQASGRSVINLVGSSDEEADEKPYSQRFAAASPSSAAETRAPSVASTVRTAFARMVGDTAPLRSAKLSCSVCGQPAAYALHASAGVARFACHKDKCCARVDGMAHRAGDDDDCSSCSDSEDS